MKKSIIAQILLSILSISHGKKNEGIDLDPGAPIRIGVKKRIDAKDCE